MKSTCWTIPEGVTEITPNYRKAIMPSETTRVIIPSGVTSIGDAFSYCRSLTQIEIPSGVTSIGGWAFVGCTSLTQIEIPSGVTSIGVYAFDGCSSLTQINLPEGVTSIGKDAFSYCRSLTQIEIPEGVRSMGGEAFNGCSSLTQIEIPKKYHSAEERRRLGIDDKVRCIEPRAKTEKQKPASKQEEVRLEPKPVASGGAAAEEESKPKQAKISEEELERLQDKVSNLAKAQNVMASKAELGVASGIDAELVTWLQQAMEEVQGNASLKAYCDAMRVTLRTSFMNVAMQDAGIDASVLKEDSLLVSGVGSLLVTIGGEIPGVRSILEGISSVVGMLRNRSQKAYAKQLWAHIDKEVNHSTYILMISAGMTLGFKESLRIGRLDKSQSISQRSYAMVAGFFEEVRHKKGTESELSEIGESEASQDGMKDALGLVTSMMVVEPENGSQRIKIMQLLELTGAIRDKRKGDKSLYELDKVFELRERREVISPIRVEEEVLERRVSDKTADIALLKEFMAEQKKQAEEQARELAAVKAKLEVAEKKLGEQPEKPEAGLKQSQVQKQAMALGLGVGVVSPEQESSGGVVTADELQMTKAESKDTYSQLGLLTEELAGVKERVDGLEHQRLKKEKSSAARCRMS